MGCFDALTRIKNKGKIKPLTDEDVLSHKGACDFLGVNAEELERLVSLFDIKETKPYTYLLTDIMNITKRFISERVDSTIDLIKAGIEENEKYKNLFSYTNVICSGHLTGRDDIWVFTNKKDDESSGYSIEIPPKSLEDIDYYLSQIYKDMLKEIKEEAIS